MIVDWILHTEIFSGFTRRYTNRSSSPQYIWELWELERGRDLGLERGWHGS